MMHLLFASHSHMLKRVCCLMSRKSICLDPWDQAYNLDSSQRLQKTQTSALKCSIILRCLLLDSSLLLMCVGPQFSIRALQAASRGQRFLRTARGSTEGEKKVKWKSASVPALIQEKRIIVTSWCAGKGKKWPLSRFLSSSEPNCGGACKESATLFKQQNRSNSSGWVGEKDIEDQPRHQGSMSQTGFRAPTFFYASLFLFNVS